MPVDQRFRSDEKDSSTAQPSTSINLCLSNTNGRGNTMLMAAPTIGCPQKLR